ncbi:Csu type fimbrial protein [Glaciimonas soli]|nr:spore coat U domain-containing protein [Glaciimonas soli]
MKKHLKWFTVIFALTAPLSAHALLADCSVAATGISFGPYASPGTTGITNPGGNVAVTCNGLGLLVSYTITLSAGNGTFANRLLKLGSNTITYNVYSNSTYTQIWGDGTSGTSTISDSYILSLGSVVRNYPAYGSIPGGQNKPAGTYSDTLTVTITY